MRESASTPRRDWMLDEPAGAGRENLDAGHVDRYDAKEDADASGELLFCQGLGLPSDASVVDLGAGTGQFALQAAAACAHVVAVEAWCAGAEGRGIERDWSRAELAEHVREEHSTFSWLLETMIERSGLRIADASYSPESIFASYVLRRA